MSVSFTVLFALVILAGLAYLVRAVSRALNRLARRFGQLFGFSRPRARSRSGSGLRSRLRSSPRSHTYVIVGRNDRDRPIYEHRVIAERNLGRRLRRGEVVHHINGVRDDNRVENLCVMTSSDHKNFHAWYDSAKKHKRVSSKRKMLSKLTGDFNGVLLTSAR